MRETLESLRREVSSLHIKKTAAELRRHLQKMESDAEKIQRMIATLLLNVRAMEQLLPGDEHE